MSGRVLLAALAVSLGLWAVLILAAWQAWKLLDPLLP